MRTQTEQDAYPARTSATVAAPETSVPGLLAIVYGDAPSGRYQASAVAPA